MAVPRPCLVIDLVTRTHWASRRNRFYFEATVAPTGLTQLEACCNAVLTKIGSAWSAIMTTQAKIERAEGRWYGAGTAGFEANSTINGIQGALLGVTPGSPTDATSDSLADTLPDEVVLILQKRTGNTGRSQMGRWFISGLSEQVQNHGIIDAEMVGDIRGIADLMTENITVTGGFSSVLSHRHWNRKANTLMPITKCYAIRAIGTRKDRRRPLTLERV